MSLGSVAKWQKSPPRNGFIHQSFFRVLCGELGNLTKDDLETAVSKPKPPRDYISLVLIGTFVSVCGKMLLGDIFRLRRQTKANIIL